MTRSSSELQAGSSYMKRVRAGLAVPPGREREAKEETSEAEAEAEAEVEAEVELEAEVLEAVELVEAVVVRVKDVRRMVRVVVRELGPIFSD